MRCEGSLTKPLHRWQPQRVTTSNDDDRPVFADPGLTPRYLPGSTETEIVPGVQVDLPFDTGTTSDGFRWEMRVDRVDDRLACTRLILEPADPSTPVTSEAIRRFPVGR